PWSARGLFEPPPNEFHRRDSFPAGTTALFFPATSEIQTPTTYTPRSHVTNRSRARADAREVMAIGSEKPPDDLDDRIVIARRLVPPTRLVARTRNQRAR